MIKHVVPPVCIFYMRIFYMQTQNKPLWLAGWLLYTLRAIVRKQLA